jgi:putative hydrolase of HD superfamily
MRLEEQMRFVTEAGRLKAVLRQTRLTEPARQENSAEHSWHLAVMALVLADHAPPGTDLGRVIAMLLVHDLVEIDAGDLFLYADEAQHARQEAAERAAADRIFALLPAGQASSMRALWDEFEERQTQEARFARALDRLQPMLANFEAGGGTWVAHEITVDQVLPKVALIQDGSAALGGYAMDLLARAADAGMLARPAGETGRMRRAAGSEEDQLYRGDHPDRGDEDPQRERR